VAVAEGRTLNADGTITRRFSPQPELVPLPLALRAHPSGHRRTTASTGAPDATAEAPVVPALKPGDRAVFVGLAHLGAVATVLPAAGGGVDEHGKPIQSSGMPVAPLLARKYQHVHCGLPKCCYVISINVCAFACS
jgi:hypothetical protein